MVGLALSIALTVAIAIGLALWKMATVIGVPATLFCVAGATAIMVVDYIRDHPKK